MIRALAIFALLLTIGRARAETVFVAGGAGRTGLEIVRALAAAGHTIRAGTRDITRHHETIPGVTWVAGDVLDPAALNQALAGADAVVAALGHRDIAGPDAPQIADYLAVRVLTDAARAHKVRRMILISAANVGPFEDHRLTPRSGFLLYWKTKGENYLKASGVPFTIVGPGGLKDTDDPGPGVRVLPRGKYEYPGYVSRRRVAEVAVAALGDTGAAGK